MSSLTVLVATPDGPGLVRCVGCFSMFSPVMREDHCLHCSTGTEFPYSLDSGFWDRAATHDIDIPTWAPNKGWWS